MAPLIEKRSPPLIKVQKNVPHRFKMYVAVGNGNYVVVTHQIYYYPLHTYFYL